MLKYWFSWHLANLWTRTMRNMCTFFDRRQIPAYFQIFPYIYFFSFFHKFTDFSNVSYTFRIRQDNTRQKTRQDETKQHEKRESYKLFSFFFYTCSFRFGYLVRTGTFDMYRYFEHLAYYKNLKPSQAKPRRDKPNQTKKDPQTMILESETKTLSGFISSFLFLSLSFIHFQPLSSSLKLFSLLMTCLQPPAFKVESECWMLNGE